LVYGDSVLSRFRADSGLGGRIWLADSTLRKFKVFGDTTGGFNFWLDTTAARRDSSYFFRLNYPRPNSTVRVKIDTTDKVHDYRFEVANTRVLPTPSESQSRFGIAVECGAGCTKLRPADGPAYWKYDAPPAIAAIQAGSPAERAGIRVGDRVTKVDGLPVMEEQGAVRLFNSGTATSLQLTVLRNGKEITVALRMR
jgi:hypothetical protein